MRQNRRWRLRSDGYSWCLRRAAMGAELSSWFHRLAALGAKGHNSARWLPCAATLRAVTAMVKQTGFKLCINCEVVRLELLTTLH